MTSEVPAGIRATIARWGRQKRRVWTGHGEWYLDSKGLRKVHVDGYAASFMGKLMEERDGCGQGARRQYWAEVMWGDGLDVQRVLPGMPERAFMALHLHYVFDPEFGLSQPRKAALLDLKLTLYKDAIDRAEWWLWARLDTDSRPATQLTVLIEKIMRGALQTQPVEFINSHTERAGPHLDLAPLNRSTISLKPKVA